jgi:hypothetical protein
VNVPQDDEESQQILANLRQALEQLPDSILERDLQAIQQRDAAIKSQ